MNIDFNYLNVDIVSQLLNLLMTFAIAFVPILMGVYSKEYYDIFKKKKRKIRLNDIFMCSLILSVVSMSVVMFVLPKFGLIITFSVLFLIGALSNKIIEMVFDGRLIKIFGRFIIKSKGTMQDSINEIMEDEIKDDTQKKK